LGFFYGDTLNRSGSHTIQGHPQGGSQDKEATMPVPTEVKVLREDGKTRSYNDAEQVELQRRTEAEEPLFDEDRDGYVPPEEARKQEAVELGLEEDATQENIDAKKEEQSKAEEEEKAKKAEAELSDEEKKALEESDEQGRLDLISQKELELEHEEDEEKKGFIEAELAKMHEVIDGKKEKKEEEEPETVEDEIKAFMEEKEVTEEIAREVFDGREAILKKYENNPKKLAMAFRSMHQQYSKTKNDLDNTAKALKQVEFNTKFGEMKPEDILVHPDGKNLTREEVVEKYRESYPGLTDPMEDDAVYDLCKKEVFQKVSEAKTKASATLKSDATAKRTELISDLALDAEPYKEGIKEMLDNCSDNQVMGEGFDLEDIVLWTKGKDFDKSVKEAEKRGYKRGLEQRQIMGERTSPGSSGHGRTKKVDAGDPKAHGLTAEDKTAAEELYSNDKIPLERKYELYADILRNDEKFKKK